LPIVPQAVAQLPVAEHSVILQRLVTQINEQELETEQVKQLEKFLIELGAGFAFLEQKLAKYRMIQQGMMQELLTGKTRLA